MLRVSQSNRAVLQLLKREGRSARDGSVVGLLEGDDEAVELVELLIDVVVDAVADDSVLFGLGALHQSIKEDGERREKETGGFGGRAS